jgi:hypothetical protein
MKTVVPTHLVISVIMKAREGEREGGRVGGRNVPKGQITQIDRLKNREQLLILLRQRRETVAAAGDGARGGGGDGGGRGGGVGRSFLRVVKLVSEGADGAVGSLGGREGGRAGGREGGSVREDRYGGKEGGREGGSIKQKHTCGKKNISAVEGRVIFPLPESHKPAMTRKREDLPVPLLPTMRRRPPGGRRRERSRTWEREGR